MKFFLLVADWVTFLIVAYLIQKWVPNTNEQWWLLGLFLANNIAAIFRGRYADR